MYIYIYISIYIYVYISTSDVAEWGFRVRDWGFYTPYTLNRWRCWPFAFGPWSRRSTPTRANASRFSLNLLFWHFRPLFALQRGRFRILFALQKGYLLIVQAPFCFTNGMREVVERFYTHSGERLSVLAQSFMLGPCSLFNRGILDISGSFFALQKGHLWFHSPFFDLQTESGTWRGVLDPLWRAPLGPTLNSKP